MLQVRAESVIMHGYATKGLVIAPGSFSGWSSGTTRRGPKANKPNGGDYAIRRMSGSRQVPISGTCLADSEAELLHMGEQLTGLGAGGDLVRVIVEQAGKTTWADAFVDGETTFEQVDGHNHAKFDIEFYFPSPLKFGDIRRDSSGAPWPFASGEPAYHYGNFQAVPTFVIAGSRPEGYVINGPAGMSRTVTVPLVAGQPHTIDGNTGRLSIGGVVVSRSGYGDMWGIPPGGQVVSTLVGAGTMTQTVKDTYY